VVARIDLVPLPGQATGEFQLNPAKSHIPESGKIDSLTSAKAGDTSGRIPRMKILLFWRTPMKPATKFLPALVILAMLLCPIKLVRAQVPDPQTLSAEWWQWTFSIPRSVNPLLAQQGENKCMIGQRGPVWFLTGDPSGSGQTITRTCDVPEGATLFFPVINFVDINTPPTTCGKRVQNAKNLQAETQPAINSIHSVSVTLDGRNITNTVLRLIPQPFEVALPPDNLFAEFGCPEGIYSPAVDGGDYVLISPLTPGDHTIHFHGESDSTFFDHVEQDVTYNLTIVPVSLK
jgi:hypothetical protein